MSGLPNHAGNHRQNDPLARIDVDLIDDGPQLRQLRAHRLEVTKHDIDFQGQRQPILVVQTGDRYQLVVGAYPLAAIKALKHKEIDVKIWPEGTPDAELRYAQLMDEINREELSKLERAEYLADLKETWAKLNPAARHGGDRRSANVGLIREEKAEKSDQSPVFGLCSDLAKKAGLSRSVFMEAVKISNGLSSAIKDRIWDTWLENHQAGLSLLANQTAEMQVKVCDLLFSAPAKAGSVADAVALASGRALLTDEKILHNKMNSGWERMNGPDRDAFVTSHRKTITEIFEKNGWSI